MFMRVSFLPYGKFGQVLRRGEQGIFSNYDKGERFFSNSDSVQLFSKVNSAA
jgi:hypothetical protein